MKYRRVLFLLFTVVIIVFMGVSYRQERLNSALISALKRDDAETARGLLAQGADPNARDWSGRQHSFLQGTSTTSDRYELVPTALQVSLNTPAPAATASGNASISGNAPSGKRAIIEALLNRGADAKVIDESGFSTFGIAIRQNCADVALLCLEKGASVNYFEIALAFEKAIKNRDADLVKTLLEKGAAPNQEIPGSGTIRLDNWQWSYSHLPALIYAVIDHAKTPEDTQRNRMESVIKVLLNGGADLSIKDSEGRTALIWAAFQSNENMVSLLLKRGADRTQAAKDGAIALDIARKRNNQAILRLLRQPGATG